MNALRHGPLRVGLPVPVKGLGLTVGPQGLFEKTGGVRQTFTKMVGVEVIAGKQGPAMLDCLTSAPLEQIEVIA